MGEVWPPCPPRPYCPLAYGIFGGRNSHTVDRYQFPSLSGMQPEGILGPDVNIVMVFGSEGWGQGGFDS